MISSCAKKGRKRARDKKRERNGHEYVCGFLEDDEDAAGKQQCQRKARSFNLYFQVSVKNYVPTDFSVVTKRRRYGDRFRALRPKTDGYNAACVNEN